MKLNELINALTPISVIGDTNKEITSVTFDSREVREGSLFVAQRGTSFDGHEYIASAIGKGAAAIICEHCNLADAAATIIIVNDSNKALGMAASWFYGEPSKHLTLVGVTGTNGKTTIATLLYRLTREMGHKAGLLSTVCNYIDDEEVPSTHTTPDAVQLNQLLKRMVDAGCEYAFMEVSSHSIAQERIAGLDFDGAVFTNLTRDHLDYHKTFDNYRDTKKRLFDALKSEAFAITNEEDKNGLVMTQNTRAQVYTYSTRGIGNFSAKILEEGFDGMLLQMYEGMLGIPEVFVPLVGRFNVSNFLAIYATATALGFSRYETLRILSTLKPVNGRFETIHSKKGWTAIVDYAHTPDAVDNVIKTINEILKHKGKLNFNEILKHRGKLITVIGCGGNRDKGKRPQMAQIAMRGSDQLILTSDNPRDEEPEAILADMMAGLSEQEQQHVLVIADRRQAIRTACTLAQQGDVILVAGKGHEDYQIIKGVKYHFDDHEEILSYENSIVI